MPGEGKEEVTWIKGQVRYSCKSLKVTTVQLALVADTMQLSHNFSWVKADKEEEGKLEIG